MEGIIGIRYAKALVNLTAQDQLDATAIELGGIAGLYEESSDFQNLITAKHNMDAKIQSVGEIAKQAGLSDLTNRFLRYLTSQGRFSLIGQIALSFAQEADKLLGRTKAQLVLAREISQAELDQIQSKLAKYVGKEIQMQVTIDPTILGGAVAQIGSQVLDGSVKNKLNRIRETISKGS